MSAQLHAVPDPHARLGDPFGTGKDNIVRHRDSLLPSAEDDELRESMASAGWLPGHPAIQDEFGAVITGHRRLAIAAELGIVPDIMVIDFGSGDAADIKRLKTAWLSNTGAKPPTQADRQQMSAYLASRGWTQTSIAEALNVAQSTIARDLSLVIHPSAGHPEVAEAIASGKRRNAPGGGRPRGTTRAPARHPEPEPPPLLDNLAPHIEARVALDTVIWPLLDQGEGQARISRVTGHDRRTVRDSQERWYGGLYWRTVRNRMMG